MIFQKKHFCNEYFSLKRITGLLLIPILIFLLPANLKAQQNLPDSLLDVRLETIQQMLKKDATATGTWWWGWLGGYSAATAAQTAVGLASENLKTRQDMFLGAATTFVGAAGQFITPVKLSKYPERLNQMPQNTYSEKQKKLETAEDFLQERALAEVKGRSWQVHAVSTAINLGSGLITWFGFKRDWQAGLINFAINEAITEAQIWSQPIRAKKSLAAYQQSLAIANDIHSRKPKVNYAFGAGPGGINFRITF